MSTITKLDPRVRRARADRRDLIVSLRQTPNLNPPGMVLLSRLELIRRNPRHPGNWKEEMAEDATNRMLAQTRLPTDTPAAPGAPLGSIGNF